MLEKERDVQKLKDIIRKKFPDLQSEEIEKRANELLEVGLFLVHLNVKSREKGQNNSS